VCVGACGSHACCSISLSPPPRWRSCCQEAPGLCQTPGCHSHSPSPWSLCEHQNNSNPRQDKKRQHDTAQHGTHQTAHTDRQLPCLSCHLWPTCLPPLLFLPAPRADRGTPMRCFKTTHTHTQRRPNTGRNWAECAHTTTNTHSSSHSTQLPPPDKRPPLPPFLSPEGPPPASRVPPTLQCPLNTLPSPSHHHHHPAQHIGLCLATRCVLTQAGCSTAAARPTASKTHAPRAAARSLGPPTCTHLP
jgi:hypothetical protein